MKSTKFVDIIIHAKKADNFCDSFIVEVISYDVYSSLGCPGENFIPCVILYHYFRRSARRYQKKAEGGCKNWIMNKKYDTIVNKSETDQSAFGGMRNENNGAKNSWYYAAL